MKVIVFGSSGALGSTICTEFQDNDWEVEKFHRESTGKTTSHEVGSMSQSHTRDKFNAAVFSQGLNISDSIFSHTEFETIMESNLGFIIKNIQHLLTNQLLSSDARITILSSIWQSVSKRDKFSYTISKSAIHGLVNSLVADLSPMGISINAICPGVVRTPMSSANLTEQQISNLEKSTPLRALVTPNQVAKATFWISSPSASGVNGQFITVDNGWKNVREI